jgi:phosphosulfolactate phosphohydrolase-like enzyme
VLCTTNGTPALLRAVSQAEEVLVGSLLNLDAVVDAIPAERELTVICSGTDGRFALEDAYAAGRIVERLAGPRSDAARGAERLAAGYPDSGAALAESGRRRRPSRDRPSAGYRFCARGSVSSDVPRALAGRGGSAIVGSGVR